MTEFADQRLRDADRGAPGRRARRLRSHERTLASGRARVLGRVRAPAKSGASPEKADERCRALRMLLKAGAPAASTNTRSEGRTGTRATRIGADYV